MLESSKGIRGKWAEWAASPRKSFWVMLVLVILTSLAFMSLLPASTWYEVMGFLDTFCYIGYGYTYPERWYEPSYYKISRLPWILFLSVYYNLINSDYAIPLLAVSRTLVQAMLAYIVAWRFTRNLVSASLTGIFVGASSLWYSVGGWNYHAVPGGIFLWAAMAFLPLEIPEVSLKRYLPSFVCFSLGLHTSPYGSINIPAFIVLCFMPFRNEIFLNMRDKYARTGRFFLRIAVYAAGSFILTTACLMGIHKILYGTSRFYTPNLRYMRALAKNPVLFDVYHQAMTWDWLMRPYILFIAAMIFCSLFVLLKRCVNSKQVSSAAVFSACSFLIAFMCFFVIHLYGSTGLGYAYLAFPLQCYGILPLLAVIDAVFPAWRSSLKMSVLLLLGVCVFSVVACANYSILPSYRIALLVVALFFLMLACLHILKKHAYVLGAASVIFLLCSMLFQDGKISQKSDSATIALNRAILRHYQFILNLNEKEILEGRADRSLENFFSTAYLEDDEFGDDKNFIMAKDALFSFTMLGFGFLGEKWGDCALSPEKKYGVRYNDGMRVIALGSSQDLDVKIEDGLKNLGLDPELQHMRMESSEGIDVYMWVYGVKKQRDADG